MSPLLTPLGERHPDRGTGKGMPRGSDIWVEGNEVDTDHAGPARWVFLRFQGGWTWEGLKLKSDLMLLKDHWLLNREMNVVRPPRAWGFVSMDSTNLGAKTFGKTFRSCRKTNVNLPRAEHRTASTQTK